MVLILILFSFVFFSSPIQAKSFSYQFNLANNVINLDFYRALDLPLPTLTLIPSLTPIYSPTPTSPKKILVFDYQIKTSKELPINLPLFIVVFGQEVVFSADAFLADGVVHHVELDLELFNSNYIDQSPIFSQNNYLNDYELTITNLSFLEKFSAVNNETLNQAKIENLSVIREADQSLTIIFSLSDKNKIVDSYTLLCKDESKQLLGSARLVKTDDFLWPNFIFSNFSTNHKNDLIFHLKEFTCVGLMSVLSGSGDEFIVNSIIEVKDL